MLRTQDRYDEAIESFRTALRIDPGNPFILNDLGMTLNDQGGSAQTEPWYRKAIAVAPDFVEAYNDPGCALQDEDRSMEAGDSRCVPSLRFIRPHESSMSGVEGTRRCVSLVRAST